MKTIVVNKYGSVFRTQEYARRMSKTGEGGETEGLLRHLVARGDCHVVYFGQHDGTIEGVDFIKSDLSRIRELGGDPLAIGAEDQELGFAADYAKLRHREVVALLTVDGYSPTFSHVNNPHFATVQTASLCYAAPTLALLRKLEVPRISINNDPRCHPKDQEMSYPDLYSDWVRPRACLGQCNSDDTRVVGKRKYRRVVRHARAESWAYRERREPAPWDARLRDHTNVIAHSHLNVGCKSGDPYAWNRVFKDAGSLTHEYVVYGDGWDAKHHTLGEFEFVKFPGPCKQEDVWRLLQTALCNPVVSHTPGFYTGKPWVLVEAGVVPLLFGDGSHSHTYDPYQVLLPLTDGGRIVKPGDLDAHRRLFASDKACYEDVLAGWQERLQPDWSTLDCLVDSLLAGDFREDIRWGGYFRC